MRRGEALEKACKIDTKSAANSQGEVLTHATVHLQSTTISIKVLKWVTHRSNQRPSREGRILLVRDQRRIASELQRQASTFNTTTPRASIDSKEYATHTNHQPPTTTQVQVYRRTSTISHDRTPSSTRPKLRYRVLQHGKVRYNASARS